MNKPSVGNNDRCGRCGVRHNGGNNHLCQVHGPVSAGCCEPGCRREEWELIEHAAPSPPYGAPSRWRRRAAPSP